MLKYAENLTFDCVQIDFFGERTEQIPPATEDFLGKNCICVYFWAFVYFVTTMIFFLLKSAVAQKQHHLCVLGDNHSKDNEQIVILIMTTLEFHFRNLTSIYN